MKYILFLLNLLTVLLIQLPVEGYCDQVEISFEIKTSNGDSIATDTRVYFHTPGESDSSPLFFKYGSSKSKIPVGVYDLKFRFKDGAVTRQQWMRGVNLDRDQIIESVFDLTLASIRFDFTNNSAKANYDTKWTLFAVGDDRKALPTSLGGSRLVVEQGIYDIKVSFKKGNLNNDIWLRSQYVSGDQRRELELALPMAAVTVNTFDGGSPLPHSICRVYNTKSSELTGSAVDSELAGAVFNGEQIYLNPGSYEFECSWTRTTTRADGRTESIAIPSGERTLNIDLKTRSINVADLDLSAEDREAGSGEIIIELPERQERESSENDGEQAFLTEQKRVDGTLPNFNGARIRKNNSELVNFSLQITASNTVEQSSTSSEKSPSNQGTADKPQVEIILDLSNSMWGQIDGVAKIDIAKQVLAEVIQELPLDKFQLALRAYGMRDRTLRDCRDSKLLLPMEKHSASEIVAAIQGLKPSGYTPLAYSLEQAQLDFAPNSKASLIIITDGIESCGGDPCKVASELAKKGLITRSFVVGFDLDNTSSEYLSCVGRYFPANDQRELAQVLRSALSSSSSVAEGKIAIFEHASTDKLIASAALGELIQLEPGRYDLVIYTPNGDKFNWTDFELNSDTSLTLSESQLRERSD